MKQTCPLCQDSGDELFYKDSRRHYYQCNLCQLVFVPESFHLSNQDEKAEYDKHENSINDPGYLSFLSRTTTPVADWVKSRERVQKDVIGLDFGCGPTPALATVMEKLGCKMSIYDPYYFPDTSYATSQYDFITATEVIEHIAQPKSVIALWYNLLKPKGLLAIMTKRVIDRERFATWHYKNDPTHISFYSEATFVWLAEQYKLRCNFVDKDVVFLSKP